MRRFYLGIDGGQSSTKALIADENGLIIGRGTAGPCNHVSAAESEERFRSVLRGCIGQACSEAEIHVESARFAAVCLGLSGGPADKEALTRAVIASDKYKLTHDADIALTGATAGEPGIIIIAGTGSIAFGRNRTGRSARAGGWGYIIGDEGGAFDIVRRALRAALQMEEGWGKPTRLRQILLEATGSADANHLLHAVYSGMTRQAVAGLAPLVDGTAKAGDAAALEVLHSAAAALVEYLRAVYSNLFTNGDAVPVAYIGGAFRSEALRFEFELQIRSQLGCKTGPPIMPPAAGALLEALRLDSNLTSLTGNWFTD